MGSAVRMRDGLRAAGRLLREERAQGTTEYAILVGVLVVIALISVIALVVAKKRAGKDAS